MAPLLSVLINLDQVGFMPTRETSGNTIRVLDLAFHAGTEGRPSLLLSMDTEKAFDRVQWDFIRATLRHVGVKSNMEALIMSLYGNLSTVIVANGFHSQVLELKNWTDRVAPWPPAFSYIPGTISVAD